MGTTVVRSDNKSHNPIPSGLSGTVSGGGGLLPKGQQGLFNFSSSLKQGNCGLGPDLSQNSRSYCNMNEPNKWSSSIPCNSALAAGQAGVGVIGGAGLEQTNEEAGLLPNGPTTGTSTSSLAVGPLLPSDKLLKGKCQLTSTTMMTEEDSLSEVVGEVHRGWQSRQSKQHHPQCTAPERGVFKSTASHIVMSADSLISSAGEEYREQNRQPEQHLSQSTVPVLGVLNTPLHFDMPEDSLSLAAGETIGGQSSRLPEHFPRSRNMTAIGDLSTTTAHLGKSANSLSLTAGEVYVKKTKLLLQQPVTQGNVLTLGALSSTDLCPPPSYRFTITSC